MVGPVQRGTRSKNDSEDWVCDNCKATNKASQLLLFDVPKLTCSCGREGPDFQLNMREIEVNGHSIIRYVKLQKGPKCIANAYSAAMETKMCIRELRHKRDPSLLPEFDSEKLWDTLGENYPGQVGNMKPRDKLVHMGLALKHKGVKALNGKKYYKISDISTIKSTDIQAMFNAIGNGEPLVAGVRVGKSLHKLKWCKVYKAPSRQRHLDKNNRVINHCVVFIGGGKE